MERSHRVLGILCVSLSVVCANPSPLVTLDQGQLQGLTYTSRNGTEYYGYLGIPFAKPPIGDLRFQLPQEPDPWDGIFNATTELPFCVQTDTFTKTNGSPPILGQEDCLYLNVYAPSTLYSRKVPVITFLYGGAFIEGWAGGTKPDYFMDYQVVMVFPNYRVGPFGFLTTNDSVIPENVGLRDQVAALQWVQKNIAAFGGDPDLVTIFGQSAGAASVEFHLYSPLSTGLFHRGISHSGTHLALWAIQKPSIAFEKTLEFGILAGCPIETSEALVTCLRNISAEELTLIQQKFFVWDYQPTTAFRVPTQSDTDNQTWLTQKPVNKVPCIKGMNSAEGIILGTRYFSKLPTGGYLADQLYNNYTRLFPLIFNMINWFNYNDSLWLTEKIKQYYFGDAGKSMETVEGVVNMITDEYYLYFLIKAAAVQQADTFVYLYDHHNVFSFCSDYGSANLSYLGVCHDDDLISFFTFLGLDAPSLTPSDVNTSKALVEMWVNFARSGNPNNDDYDLWQPFDVNQMNYLHIMNDSLEMENGLYSDRFSFWESIMSQVTET